MSRFYKLSKDVKSYLVGNQEFALEPDSLTGLAYPLDLEFTLQNEDFYYTPKDVQGLPVRVYQSVGQQYNPTRLAAYGLAHFNRYLRTNDENSRTLFFKMADWFMQSDDALWQYQFDWGDIKAPWISCMSQGEGISVLTRAFHLTGEEQYRQQALKALLPLCLPLEKGGLSSQIDGEWLFLEEYPSSTPEHVLNGYLYALIGMWDLIKIDKRVAEKANFEQHLSTLKSNINRWDVGYWSTYDLSPRINGVYNAVTVSYHKLHITQLNYLGFVTATPELCAVAKRWENYLANPINRLKALSYKLRYRRAKPAQF
jgi:heparosan-N-sulfate-glucuronate 5-epimerase